MHTSRQLSVRSTNVLIYYYNTYKLTRCRASTFTIILRSSLGIQINCIVWYVNTHVHTYIIRVCTNKYNIPPRFFSPVRSTYLFTDLIFFPVLCGDVSILFAYAMPRIMWENIFLEYSAWRFVVIQFFGIPSHTIHQSISHLNTYIVHTLYTTYIIIYIHRLKPQERYTMTA